MHAPQVVQAQAASGESAKESSGLGLGAPCSNAVPLRELVQLHALVDLERGGAEALPVAVAGQTSWQRLHWMQA